MEEEIMEEEVMDKEEIEDKNSESRTTYGQRIIQGKRECSMGFRN
jgi:hypothetical protein